MISNKWIDLLNFTQQKTSAFPSIDTITEALNQRVMFMKNQFSETPNQTTEYIDWVEHEVFSSVMSDALKKPALKLEQAEFLYDLFLSVNLCQLCMSLLNHHGGLFPKGELEIKQGIALQRMGEAQQAELAFHEASKLLPDSGLPLYHLAYCQLYSGNADLALELFNQSAGKSPGFAPVWQSIAGCHYQESRFEDALTACQKARDLDSSIAPCYITAISSLLALERPEEALIWLNLATQNQINSPELDRLSGLCALQNNQPEAAIMSLSKYLEVHPDDMSVVAILAQALAVAEKWKEIQDVLLRLLKTDPHNHWCLEQLFLSYFHTKQWPKAEVVMNQLKQTSEYYSNTYHEQFEKVNQQQSIVLSNVNVN
ncbi:tetratricopeptide repeat protein [Vibrio sp. HN007]|uniref:tetratricopeptide repeat protein n=1 Tax=Vibrio iocasae TaxID=3098914 RepID=UPI0035D4CF74